MRMARGLAIIIPLAGLSLAAPRLQAIEPLFSRVGTGTLLHPLEEPTNLAIPQDFQTLRCCTKEQVHIFAVNGVNPMCLGNFNGFCEYLKKQGFTNTHFAQMYTYFNFPEQIRSIRRSDPEARIVLIGYSLGCNPVRSVANNLGNEGIRIDLLVYLAGDYIANTPESTPPNVERILNIRGNGLVLVGGDLLFNGADLDGARNHKLPVRHILVPSRQETLEIVSEELLAMMCRPHATALPVNPTQNVTVPGRKAN